MILILCCIILCISPPSFVECRPNFDRFGWNHPGKTRTLVNLNNLKSSDYSGYRLPTNLEPTQYNLLFIPYLGNATFQGQANITFNVVNETDVIVLNIRNDSLKINSASLTFNYDDVTLTNITVDEEHQMVWFNVSEPLEKQEGAIIRIEFEGNLTNDMMGFYLSTYKNNGSRNEQRLAITQFEGTYARRAFPCFDEPAYRANFSISILRPSNMTSMSNMKLETSTNVASELFLDTYETSPAMPTYLVAFGMSNFSSKSDGGIVTVFTRPDAIDDTAVVLDVSQKILYSIGNFTGVPYPLKKMDLVAVPDFKAGAMENWGLTTYREKYILFNDSKNTHMDRFSVVSVIAHEFAHQWFGDLVTPLWWDYTWLNEAFATYFEYTTTNQLFPEWGIGDSQYIVALQSALAQDDETSNPRPMTSPVFTPDQIENVFDYVIYDKGGSILRMMENYLTTAFWKKGLNIYLTKNAYKTGTPSDLFSALEAANPTASQVAETFTKWTSQPSYPLVKLQKTSGSEYLITQNSIKNNSNLTWNIPITYTTQENGQFDVTKAATLFLNTTNQNVTINTTGWIILNIDQTGYFRVNYEDDNWNKIIDQLKSKYSVIGTINRAQLLDDACNLAKLGYIDFSICMDLSRYLSSETQYLPWKTFYNNMQFLVNQFYNTPTGDRLMYHSRDLLQSPFQTFVSDSKKSNFSFLDYFTQRTIGQFSCDMSLSACENWALSNFKKWAQNPYSIPPELREPLICTQLRVGSSYESFWTVLNYTLSSDSDSEKLMLYRALGCTTDEALINQYLSVICDVDTNGVILQNRAKAFNAVLSRQSGVGPGLQFLINNYDNVNKAFGGNIDSLFSTLGNTISQEKHIAQVKSLMNDSSVDQRLKEKLKTLVIPSMEKRQAWSQSAQASQLKIWLEKNISSTASLSTAQLLYTVMLSAVILIHL